MGLVADLDKALDVVLKIKDPEVRLKTLGKLIKALDAAGRDARAERLELVKQLRRDKALTWDRLHVLSGLSTVYLLKKAGPKSQAPAESEPESTEPEDTETEGSGEPAVEFDPYYG